MARLHLIRENDLHNCYWGVSTSLWFNGCPHRCKGCWNQDTWDVDESMEIDNDSVVKTTLEYLDKNLPKDLTLLGGEPLMPNANLEDTIYIVGKIKEARPHTRVLCWTGYNIEYLLRHEEFSKALGLIDILVDGRYIESKHVTGKLYGSSNQRIIDVKKTLVTGIPVIAKEKYNE